MPETTQAEQVWQPTMLQKLADWLDDYYADYGQSSHYARYPELVGSASVIIGMLAHAAGVAAASAERCDSCGGPIHRASGHDGRAMFPMVWLHDHITDAMSCPKVPTAEPIRPAGACTHGMPEYGPCDDCAAMQETGGAPVDNQGRPYDPPPWAAVWAAADSERGKAAGE